MAKNNQRRTKKQHGPRARTHQHALKQANKTAHAPHPRTSRSPVETHHLKGRVRRARTFPCQRIQALGCPPRVATQRTRAVSLAVSPALSLADGPPLPDAPPIGDKPPLTNLPPHSDAPAHADARAPADATTLADRLSLESATPITPTVAVAPVDGDVGVPASATEPAGPRSPPTTAKIVPPPAVAAVASPGAVLRLLDTPAAGDGAAAVLRFLVAVPASPAAATV